MSVRRFVCGPMYACVCVCVVSVGVGLFVWLRVRAFLDSCAC